MRYVITLAVLLSAAAVFACGGDDDDDNAVPEVLADVCTETEGAIGPDVIDVDLPAAGDEVESPITVEGTADISNPQFFIAVVDADGDRLIDYPVAVGDGADAPFSQTVPFSVFAETPACLWVFEQNLPEPDDAIRIPITLIPDGVTESP